MSLNIDLYYICDGNEIYVYSANITHNLTSMANYVGVYECIWRPKEFGFNKASDLIEKLQYGLEGLMHKRQCKKYEPENKWGTFESFVEFVSDYLQACKLYPNAKISASR